MPMRGAEVIWEMTNLRLRLSRIEQVDLKLRWSPVMSLFRRVAVGHRGEPGIVGRAVVRRQ